jgi:hypothetical protein
VTATISSITGAGQRQQHARVVDDEVPRLGDDVVTGGGA